MSRLLCAAAVVAMLAAAHSARAQDSLTEAQAQRLFDEGRALMDQSRYAEACPKLLASERAAPSGGTLLNLADCYERDGKTASAWGRFKEAAARAAAAKRPDIEAHAEKRAAALAARLSTLTVIVVPENDTPGLSLRRGDEALDRAGWGTALPVDSGTYTVEAVAPGRRPWLVQITIGAAAEHATLTVPRLQPDDRQPATPAPPLAPPAAWSTQKTIALGVAAGGVVGIGLGAIFGLSAISKNGEAEEHCPASPQCLDERGPTLTRDAQDAATVSTVAFAAGGALAAAGVVLWLTAPKSSVSLSAGVRSIGVGGTF